MKTNMRLNGHPTETELVDGLLGKTDAEKRRNLEEHIGECADCARIWRQWTAILNAAPETVPKPSASLRRTLKLRFALRAAVVRMIGDGRLRPLAAFAVLGILLLLSLPVLYERNAQDPVTPLRPPETALAFADRAQAIVADPQTTRFRVGHSLSGHVTGSVWVNPESDEMVLMFRGLDPLTGQDYQAWITYRNKRLNGGVLQWDGRHASLYYRGDGGLIRKAENLLISVEPKGGSSRPTGPNTVVVSLKGEPSS